MRFKRIHVLLFIATVVTTFIAGYAQGGDFASGVSFSAALIFILGSHEMGHYYYGRKYGVSITPPYFIPAPYIPFVGMLSPIGTFGAFIKIKSQISSKKALFDIGVAGPIWGIIAAIPILIVGLKNSSVVEVSSQHGISLGSSPIFLFFSRVIFGDISDGFDILLHPVAFAGWIGLLVTFLNLIPCGQLDGGHLIYSIFSKEIHKAVSSVSILLLLVLGIGTKPLLELMNFTGTSLGGYEKFIIFDGWQGWIIWAFLLAFFLGTKHPPTIYEEADIGFKRKVVACITLLIFIGCFILVPVTFK